MDKEVGYGTYVPHSVSICTNVEGLGRRQLHLVRRYDNAIRVDRDEVVDVIGHTTVVGGSGGAVGGGME